MLATQHCEFHLIFSMRLGGSSLMVKLIQRHRRVHMSMVCILTLRHHFPFHRFVRVSHRFEVIFLRVTNLFNEHLIRRASRQVIHARAVLRNVLISFTSRLTSEDVFRLPQTRSFFRWFVVTSCHGQWKGFRFLLRRNSRVTRGLSLLQGQINGYFRARLITLFRRQVSQAKMNCFVNTWVMLLTMSRSNVHPIATRNRRFVTTLPFIPIRRRIRIVVERLYPLGFLCSSRISRVMPWIIRVVRGPRLSLFLHWRQFVNRRFIRAISLPFLFSESSIVLEVSLRCR